MMIVVVILGVLISVVGANLRGTGQRAALLGAARELVSACNVARQAAISTEREVYLRFDAVNHRWRLRLNISPEEEDRRARYDRDAVYDLEMPRELPPKIAFSKIEMDTFEDRSSRTQFPQITFFPNGSATEGIIQLTSDRGRKITIEITRATGRVEVYQGEPRDFAQKLKDLGVEPSTFIKEPIGGPDSMQGLHASADDPNAERRAREQQQRENYYQDVLSRIVEQRRQQQRQSIGEKK
jgi:Tfp pilus assembly protein FimT